MERGTVREREAVREQWAALEHQRKLATRLVLSLGLVFGGMLLLLVAGASGTEICIGAQLPGSGCDGVIPVAMGAPLVFVGTVAFAGGLVGAWTVFRG